MTLPSQSASEPVGAALGRRSSTGTPDLGGSCPRECGYSVIRPEVEAAAELIAYVCPSDIEGKRRA